jgi:UDP:flavonoid glycosyltransferase YjiC (YdhE family)
MRNITIFAFGSRGDVQPYIALGRRLQQTGYQITVLAGDEFRDFVTGAGLGFGSSGISGRSAKHRRFPQPAAVFESHLLEALRLAESISPKLWKSLVEFSLAPSAFPTGGARLPCIVAA